jgi:hypothetical protein
VSIGGGVDGARARASERRRVVKTALLCMSD